MTRTARALLTALVALAWLVTLATHAHLMQCLLRAGTNVPWHDEWIFISELPRYPSIAAFWTPHWGHRIVIPRLLFLADARWFHLSHAPLLACSFALQLLLTAALSWKAFVTLKTLPRLALAAVLAVVVHIALSAHQIENLTWAWQLQWTLVYASAISSMLLLERGLLAAACAAALVSTATMANGLFTWPVLFAQAWLLRLPRRNQFILLALGTVSIAAYAYGYHPPAVGLGAGAAMLHPISFASGLAAVLAAPITLMSLKAGVAAGAAGLMLLPVMVRASLTSRALSFWLAVAAFAILSAASVVIGRESFSDMLTIEAHGGEVFPSRYSTPSLLFWISLLICAAHTARSRVPALLVIAPILFCFTYGTFPRQWYLAEGWPDAFRLQDAIAAALLLDVPDQEYLSILWPNQPERDEQVRYLRAHRLSVFAEPRASWLGRPLEAVFQRSPTRSCEGRVEVTEPLGNWLRLKGWSWDRTADVPLRDLVITDTTHRIVGLARGGLVHPPTAALSANRRQDRPGWLGYAPAEVALRIYGVQPATGSACEIGSIVSTPASETPRGVKPPTRTSNN